MSEKRTRPAAIVATKESPSRELSARKEKVILGGLLSGAKSLESMLSHTKAFYKDRGEILVRSDKKNGDPESQAYQDKVVGAIGSLIQKRLVVTPFMVLQVILLEGGEFVSETGMNRLVARFAPGLDMEPLDVVAWGRREIAYKLKSVSIEEAVLSEFKEYEDRLVITSPTGYKILTDAELRHKRREERRAAEEKAAHAEDAEHERLKTAVLEIMFEEFAEAVTTKSLLRDLATIGYFSEKEAKDPDGKIKKRIAEVLKEEGYSPEERNVGGKKTKMFVLQQTAKTRIDTVPLPPEPPEPPEPVEGEDGALTDSLPQEVVGGPAENTDGPIASLPAEEGRPNPVDRTALPKGWERLLDEFLASASDRKFVTLEEVVASMGRVLQELKIWNRGQVSKRILSLGLSKSVYGERKAYHHPDNPPAQEELAAFFEEVDRRSVDLMTSSIGDAPGWMDEEQRKDLSFLEHAVLLLSEDGSYPRTGLFPGHTGVNWQHGVMSRLQEEGLVVVSGYGRTKTFSGSRPAIDQALDRDYLLRTFWPDSGEPMVRPEGRGEEDLVPADWTESIGQEEAQEVVTLESVAEIVRQLYGVLENHKGTIDRLKERIKLLESKVSDLEGKNDP